MLGVQHLLTSYGFASARENPRNIAYGAILRLASALPERRHVRSIYHAKRQLQQRSTTSLWHWSTRPFLCEQPATRQAAKPSRETTATTISYQLPQAASRTMAYCCWSRMSLALASNLATNSCFSHEELRPDFYSKPPQKKDRSWERSYENTIKYC